MVEASSVCLKANRRLGPLFCSCYLVCIGVLTCGGTTAIADVQGQVDADIVKVRDKREPQLARDSPHARQQHLVFPGKASQRARTGHVALLVGACRPGYLVIQLPCHQALYDKRLGGAHHRAQAAHATVVLHTDARLVDLDRIHRTDVQAKATGPDSHVLVHEGARRAAQAEDGVGARLLLVVRGVEALHVRGVGNAAGQPTEGVQETPESISDVDDVIDHVVLLCHAPLPCAAPASSRAALVVIGPASPLHPRRRRPLAALCPLSQNVGGAKLSSFAPCDGMA